MSADLIERLRERARNRVPEDNHLGMTPGDFLEGQAADALAAKDTALSEMRAELERAMEIVRLFLAVEGEAKGGLSDCIDNTGTPYQSQYFADIITRARALADGEGW